MSDRGSRGRAVAALALVTAATLGLSGLSSHANAQSGGTSLWLRGAGATFPAPLYGKWIEAYRSGHAGLSITYDSVGSSEGVNRFLTGSVDFAGTDAVLPDETAQRVKHGVVVVPATAGMVVLAYNVPGFGADLKLPRDVYPEILAGKITRWNDPRILAANPGLPNLDRTISVVARRDGSGTTFALTAHLAAISDTWKSEKLKAGTLIDWPGATMLAPGNEGVSARIKQSQWSIGYVEYGFARRLGLPAAALQNRAGQYVKPDAESGLQALSQGSGDAPDDLRIQVPDPTGTGSYPIVTYSWLLLYANYADEAKRDALQRFVSWGLTDGQRLAADMGYIPVPEQVTARGMEELAGIR